MEYELTSNEKVEEIHRVLSEIQGQHVRVRAHLGRQKIANRQAVVLCAMPSVFVLEIQERRGRVSRASFQYVDVLTGQLQLMDDEGHALFDFVEHMQFHGDTNLDEDDES